MARETQDLRDVGGTAGGFGEFFVGIALMGVGLFLLLNQVTVHGGFFSWAGWGANNSFGITLIPLILGIIMLFYDSANKLGWILFCGGLGIVLVGIIANMQIYFRPLSMVNTLIIFFLLFGGLGMFLRSLRKH